jgi:hypothetical protein
MAIVIVVVMIVVSITVIVVAVPTLSIGAIGRGVGRLDRCKRALR